MYRRIALATLLLALSQLASRVLGLVRDMQLAHVFGTEGVGIYQLDTYFAAFRVPDLIYTLIVFGGLSAAFVPVYARLKDEEKDGFVGSVLVGVLSLVALATAIAFVFAVPLARVIAPGFDTAATLQTAELMRIQLIAPLAFGLSGVLSGIAQSKHQFAWYAVAPVLYNLGIIGGVWLLGGEYGVYGASWGVAIGALLHAGVQLPLLWGNVGWPRQTLRHLKAIARLALPRNMAILVTQVQFSFIAAIASLTAGLVSSFWFAWNMASLPLGIVGLAVSTVSFGTLSRLAHEEAAFREHLTKAASSVLLLVVPASVGLYILATEVVGLVFGSGAFSVGSVAETARELQVLCLAIPALSLIPLLQNAFFARHRAYVPLTATLVGLGAAYAASFVTRSPAVLQAGGTMLTALVLAVLLGRDLKGTRIVRPVVSSLVMGVCLWYPTVAWEVAGTLEESMKIGVLASAGVAVYFCCSYLLGGLKRFW